MFRTLVVIVLSLCAVGTAQASFITNGSFETVPNSVHDQGLLPSSWFQFNGYGTVGADTYSNNGSYGLSPGDFGNFTGVTAHDGIRWVAAWNDGRTSSSTSIGNVGEAFGTTLTALLTPGKEYVLDAWLYQAVRSDLDNPGGYHVFLSNGTSAGSTLLGALAPTTGVNSWEARSITFTAPLDAASRPYLIFNSYSTNGFSAYPGLDAVSLVEVSTAVPEPASCALLGFSLAGAFALKRRKRRV